MSVRNYIQLKLNAPGNIDKDTNNKVENSTANQSQKDNFSDYVSGDSTSSSSSHQFHKDSTTHKSK